MFTFLYTPYGHPLANASNAATVLSYWLNEAEKGNGTPLWNAVKGDEKQFECQCPKSDRPPLPTIDPFYAILCGDGDKVEDSVADLEAHQARMAQDSSFAELWAFRVACV